MFLEAHSWSTRTMRSLEHLVRQIWTKQHALICGCFQTSDLDVCLKRILLPKTWRNKGLAMTDNWPEQWHSYPRSQTSHTPHFGFEIRMGWCINAIWDTNGMCHDALTGCILKDSWIITVSAAGLFTIDFGCLLSLSEYHLWPHNLKYIWNELII